jgi:hypothetical protein
VIPDILPATGGKISIGYPRTSATDKKTRIESYRHRLRSVTKCPRLIRFTFNLFWFERTRIMSLIFEDDKQIESDNILRTIYVFLTQLLMWNAFQIECDMSDENLMKISVYEGLYTCLWTYNYWLNE